MIITDKQVTVFLEAMDGVFVGTQKTMHQAVKHAMEKAHAHRPLGPPDIIMTIGGITYICDLKLPTEDLVQEGTEGTPVPDEIQEDRRAQKSVDRLMKGQDEPLFALIEDVAVMALGRFSVELFQAGNHLPKGLPGTGACPEWDYLIMRSGEVMGYGELAELMTNAVRAELEERANE